MTTKVHASVTHPARGPSPGAERAASSPRGTPCGPLAGGEARSPRQERGARRVCAILDAAAALVAELGADALTVQALAERARTSKGSLYHFFPDLPSVLRALAERHAVAIGDITRALAADPAVDWRALDARDAVRRFLTPLAYLDTHPDLLALARTSLAGDDRTRRLAPLCELAEHLLARRYPWLSSHERFVRASTMVALLDGVVSYTLRSERLARREMVVQLERVLEGYLLAIEAAGVAPPA